MVVNMVPVLRGRGFLFISGSLPHFYQLVSRSCPTVGQLMRYRSFSPVDGDGDGDRPPSMSPFARRATESAGDGDGEGNDASYCYKEDRRMKDKDRQNPPDPIPNRSVRGAKPIYQPERLSNRRFDLGGKHFNDEDEDARGYRFESSATANQKNYKPARGGGGGGGNKLGQQSGGKFGDDDGEEKMTKYPQTSPPQPPLLAREEQGNDFLEKFKLGFDKGDKGWGKPLPIAAKPQLREGEEVERDQVVPEPQLKMSPPQDADEIFTKMKETGLIPNAVAMLHGLCKDGLVQEAMKLFGLMREKGTIPEVVIYTAVVEGFCEAHKLDDAKRIFRKMQNNGILPNAFSYTVLIQGLYKDKRLEDALEMCVEMLDAGHSPNLATFTSLVDGFCREKGLEETRSMIGTLRQKGFFFDERAVRDYLDKKGPFLPLVWEAISGKKSSQRSF